MYDRQADLMVANVPIRAVWHGQPYPLGATWDGEGVNFALFSAHAERVELCVFDSAGRRELQRIAVTERTDEVWHCYLPEARPGFVYAYRVHGPYRPEEGQRFNPHKLLIEPYAYALTGALSWSDAHFGYRIGARNEEANGEGNRDGADHNYSWNCGAEGATDDSGISALRARQRRNLLATLLLSQGVPMLLAGDEHGRTQQGNNNAYCQDNEISWVDWQFTDAGRQLLLFVQRLIALRRAHPVFRRRNFLQGRPIRGGDVKDILWLTPSGREMTDDEWNTAYARCLGSYLAGDALAETDARGRPLTDVSFLVLVNAHHELIPFTLPSRGAGYEWIAMLDTHHEEGLQVDGRYAPGHAYPLEGRSLALLQEIRTGA